MRPPAFGPLGMRARWLFVLLLAPLLAAPLHGGTLAAGPERAAGICGRVDYPNASQFASSGVVDASLWQSFRESGGFDGENESQSAVEVRVPDAGRVHLVRVEEITVRSYVGGSSTDQTIVALRVREETAGGQVSRIHEFRLITIDGRAGGNLTVVARLTGGTLDIFWRFAYLPCTDDFVNVYYVFHGRVDYSRTEIGEITSDNTLVYFEAPRPRRGPPLDLILLVSAGAAVTAIFLFARRAARKPP